MLSLEELESKLSDMAARNEELEERCDRDAKNYQLLKVASSFVVYNNYYSDLLSTFHSTVVPSILLLQDEHDGHVFSIHALETELHEKRALNEELKRHLNEESEKCCRLEVPTYLHVPTLNDLCGSHIY